MWNEGELTVLTHSEMLVVKINPTSSRQRATKWCAGGVAQRIFSQKRGRAVEVEVPQQEATRRYL